MAQMRSEISWSRPSARGGITKRAVRARALSIHSCESGLMPVTMSAIAFGLFMVILRNVGVFRIWYWGLSLVLLSWKPGVSHRAPDEKPGTAKSSDRRQGPKDAVTESVSVQKW